MTLLSPLSNVIKKGSFGNLENQDNLTIKEILNISIIQIVKYKNPKLNIEDIQLNGLSFPTKSNQVNSNNNERILWSGPNNWIYISSTKNNFEKICSSFDEKNFAVTDLSHSRAILSLEGLKAKEVLKKGCPFNFNNFEKNNCTNTIFNGITVTVDMINNNPDTIHLYVLRSFGESFYHSITDASLEFGYKIL